MLAMDDIKNGMLITIVDRHEPDPVSPWDHSWRRQRGHQLAGRVFKVLAISLPYMAVECDGVTGSIDTRGLMFSRVSNDFIKALRCEERTVGSAQSSSSCRIDNCCPECGERTVQRRYESSQKWFLACSKCPWKRQAM